MKTHFIKLFNYNRFANDLLLNAITDAHVPPKPLQLFAHLLTAEQVWYSRCHSLPNKFSSPWLDYAIEECTQLVPECHDQWISYLNDLTEADFDKIIKYQNFRGDYFQDSLADILTHVINHGTHTRAQVGQQLRLAGAESLPITDYSYYLRLLRSGI
ncbi:DinB family protein [Mucilaginibacter lappiensis]|uniref:Putative damage-inducible protein DinB n=1 Tax=Mucilaginibacter lappiensis TaxID=354630 RepID=A0A841J991_9SPHI|nr:DinB family protein [Mucilaginibacter lappiensis]MBB6127663.1 putative damage-inducible protein DinB [Mucilaginibacter lappiensis]